METTNTTASEAAREQAIEAMRYNGNGPECLPHLACGGIGCDDCIGGAVKCGCCVHRVAVTTVADGTPEGMDVCGWCGDDAEKSGASECFWQRDRVARGQAPAPHVCVAGGGYHPGVCCRAMPEPGEGERGVDDAKAARAERFRELDRAWLAAGAEIRAERARGAA